MIYLDNGATTRPLFESIHNSYNLWLNSHSSYSNGDYILWECRERIAKCINCDPSEIYFTSGGCEGNTWCINILYDMLGKENIKSYSENGISWTRDGGNISNSLYEEIVPMVGVINEISE